MVVGRPPTPPEERFHDKYRVDPVSGCWVWQRGINTYGYGLFSVGRRSLGAHRYSWTRVHGPIPDGVQLDHLCRNRACVNPDHLELVTPRENTLRGEGVTATAARRDSCARGHPYTPENTYVPPSKPNARFCRECKRRIDQERRVREAARAGARS